MKILKYISLASLIMVLGCSLDKPSGPPDPGTGTADFTRYVAVGNSLTAGYQSGALTESRQLKSYPLQLATQAGVGASFVQPLLGYPGIGAYSSDTTNPAGILELTFLDNPATPNTINPDPVITPELFANHPDFNPLNPWESDATRDYPAPYNNLGIPGAILFHMLNSYDAVTSGVGNSFFDIILRNPNLGNTNAIQQASGLGAGLPTFITCWIGNNDVLGYATSGGTVGTDAATGTLPTDVPTFTFLYGQLLDSLQALGAGIVVANIPDVTAIPFFTTVPPYLLDPTINDLLLVGGNPVPILGVTPGVDLVLLTAATALGQGLGVPESLGGTGLPLPDEVVLDAGEIAIASQAVADFNSAIASLAAARNIPVADMNGFFNDVAANGYNAGGLNFTTSFLTGNLFSLDGVHPSDLGYSIITNQFIMTINEAFDATIPMVNITDELSKRSKDFNVNQVRYHPDAFHNVVKMFSGR